MSAIATPSRWIAFLFGCIGLRLLFVVVAKFASTNILPYLGMLALLPAIGFSYLWLTNSRLTGFEAGGKVWWHSWRIVHALLYFAFALSALRKQKTAYVYLALDVLLGLMLFFSHYILNIPS